VHVSVRGCWDICCVSKILEEEKASLFILCTVKKRSSMFFQKFSSVSVFSKNIFFKKIYIVCGCVVSQCAACWEKIRSRGSRQGFRFPNSLREMLPDRTEMSDRWTRIGFCELRTESNSTVTDGSMRIYIQIGQNDCMGVMLPSWSSLQ
jgi:hypothetical protein